MSRSRTLSATIVLVLVLGTVAGCGATPSPTLAPAAEPTAAVEAAATAAPEEESPTSVPEPELASTEFIGLVRNHPVTLDPALKTDNPTWKFYVGVYESLIDHKPGTMSREDLEGKLAESWEVSEDGTVYTFHLRDGVKFHDGTTLDAEDVKVSIERLAEIGLGPAWALTDLQEVNVIDDLTAEVIMKRPSVPFLDAVPLFYIVSADAVKKAEADGDELAQQWFTDHEAGSGPYTLEEWILGERYALAKFDDYWRGWEGKHYERIVNRLVEESGTQAIIFDTGEAHWADSLSLEDARKLQQDPRFNIDFFPTPKIFWMYFDTTRPPLDDVKVRQALRYAFDYKTMAEDVMLGGADISRGYLPPGFAEHDPSIPEETYDMDKAKQLLAEAGYGDGGITLDMIYFAPYDWERKGAELFAAQVMDLGIEVKITGEPWATLLEKVQSEDRRPNVVYWTASPTTGSPDSSLYQTFYSGSTHWSNFGYSNPDVDELLLAARLEFDDTKRVDLYRQVQQVLQEDSPAINSVITHYHNSMRKDVGGYVFMPLMTEVVDYYLLYPQE